jgi:Spy/CpxP family protein refolding chaperone
MPKSMTRRILIAAALLAASTFAEAQQMPPGKWWRRAEVARELELTREQQDKLDETFRGAANDLIDAKGDVEKLQVALRGELDRAQLRRPDLQRLAGQLTAARGKLFERELMMLVDMRSILDEEQWSKLRQHLDRMQDQGRERGGPMPNRPMQRRRP